MILIEINDWGNESDLEFVRILSAEKKLPLMRFGHDVTFETVFISALFFAHLAVPSELLKTFRLLTVGDVFWRASLGFRHFLLISKNGSLREIFKRLEETNSKKLHPQYNLFFDFPERILIGQSAICDVTELYSSLISN